MSLAHPSSQSPEGTTTIISPDTEKYVQQLIDTRHQQIQEDIQIREEKEEEKKHEHLQKKKRELTKQCSKLFFKREKKHYNAILKVVTKILDPINQRKKMVRGGHARIQVSMNLLNTLLSIHMGEESGSESKYQRLIQILNHANSELAILNRSPILPLDVKGPQSEGVHFDEIEKYETQITQHKREIASVGGNISVGALLQLGIGLSSNHRLSYVYPLQKACSPFLEKAGITSVHFSANSTD